MNDPYEKRNVAPCHSGANKWHHKIQVWLHKKTAFHGSCSENDCISYRNLQSGTKTQITQHENSNSDSQGK